MRTFCFKGTETTSSISMETWPTTMVIERLVAGSPKDYPLVRFTDEELEEFMKKANKYMMERETNRTPNISGTTG